MSDMVQIGPEDVKLCNCSSCDKTLLGETMHAEIVAKKVWVVGLKRHLPPPVAKRFDGRPYCQACMEQLEEIFAAEEARRAKKTEAEVRAKF